MASLNRVTLIGNLGGDPELRYTASGVPVATFNLATNETWKDKDGNEQKKTEWHRIQCWRRNAEIASEFLAKGRQVYLEGKLETRKWEDKKGETRYTTEIVVDRLILLPSGSGKGGDFMPPPPDDNDAPPDRGSAPPSAPATPASDDDLPF